VCSAAFVFRVQQDTCLNLVLMKSIATGSTRTILYLLFMKYVFQF